MLTAFFIVGRMINQLIALLADMRFNHFLKMCRRLVRHQAQADGCGGRGLYGITCVSADPAGIDTAQVQCRSRNGQFKPVLRFRPADAEFVHQAFINPR